MKKLTTTLIASSLLLTTIPAMADSPWLIRLRSIGVLPSESSSTISLIGGKVTHISNEIVPELDFSYFVTPHLAAELILGTSRHSVAATHTALGKVNLGKVSVLPPTLTAQYHFDLTPHIKPYAGVGINCTYFFNVNSGPVTSKIRYSSSVGPALQIGADFAINDHVYLNADVKKIWMNSNVTVNTSIAQLHTKVNINPWVVGLGMGYRFS